MAAIVLRAPDCAFSPSVEHVAFHTQMVDFRFTANESEEQKRHSTNTVTIVETRTAVFQASVTSRRTEIKQLGAQLTLKSPKDKAVYQTKQEILPISSGTTRENQTANKFGGSGIQSNAAVLGY